MNSRKRLAFLAIASFSLLAIGIGIGYVLIARARSGALADLDARDGLILYSIDGYRDSPDAAALADATKFYGYPVLGKVEIEDVADRQAIIAALKDGLRPADGTEVTCFWPRHGIRSLAGDNRVDLVICFQCDQIYIYRGGVFSENHKTADDAKIVLNKHLQDAGIRLAPEPGETKR